MLVSFQKRPALTPEKNSYYPLNSGLNRSARPGEEAMETRYSILPSQGIEPRFLTLHFMF
jgi:hypothetical protein